MLEEFSIQNPEVFKLSKKGKRESLREFSSIKGNEEQIIAKLPAIIWLIRIIIFTFISNCNSKQTPRKKGVTEQGSGIPKIQPSLPGRTPGPPAQSTVPRTGCQEAELAEARWGCAASLPAWSVLACGLSAQGQGADWQERRPLSRTGQVPAVCFHPPCSAAGGALELSHRLGSSPSVSAPGEQGRPWGPAQLSPLRPHPGQQSP